jgi:hypothetical protein
MSEVGPEGKVVGGLDSERASLVTRGREFKSFRFSCHRCWWSGYWHCLAVVGATKELKKPDKQQKSEVDRIKLRLTVDSGASKMLSNFPKVLFLFALLTAVVSQSRLDLRRKHGRPKKLGRPKKQGLQKHFSPKNERLFSISSRLRILLE